MKLTPIKFDAQYPDGLLEIDGMAFEWRGIKFAVHEVREAYRWPRSTLCVSHVDTGYGCGSVTAFKDYRRAAKQAVARFEKNGETAVLEAIQKAKSLRIATRLSA